jgi:beta-mannanase
MMSRQQVLRLIIAVTLAILFLVGGGSIVSTAISEAPAAISVSQRVCIPKNGAYIGAYIGDLPSSYPDSLLNIQEFEDLTGRHLTIVNRFWGMTISNSQYADFAWLNLAEYYADGKILMISWNPVDSTTENPITYQEIINGQYDNVITRAARTAADFGLPMFIRWSWEMDGDWNPSGGPNAFGLHGTQPWTGTNKPDDLNKYFGDPAKADGPERFVAAWRHIRRLFDKAEADNVIWVWSPNWISGPKPTVEGASWNILEAYYPGDDQVDWIGTSIYYRGDGGNERLTFRQMFDHPFLGPSIAKFQALHPQKPVMIAEIGASEKSDDANAKPAWIKNTYETEVKEYPYIKALLWFSVKKKENGEIIDWRVNSSEASLNAYRTAISDPYYLDQVLADNSLKPCKIFLPLITKSS